jgi:hypothetical protein
VPGEHRTGAGPRLPRATEEAAFHRAARRRAPHTARRKERVDARYSPEEKAKILTKARSLNVAAANLISTAVMAFVDGDLILPAHRTPFDDFIDELNALRAQISRIGTNANQIARTLNSGGRPHPVDAVLLARAERLLATAHATVTTIDAAAHHAARQAARHRDPAGKRR